MKLLLATALFALGVIVAPCAQAQSSEPSKSRVSAAAAQTTNADVQREIDDLTAQENMAESAGRLVTATWWQIGIGAVSMLGLLWTLAVTRSGSRMQLRAYVVVMLVKMNEIKSGEKSKALMNVKNVGATPAYELSSAITTDIVSRDDVDRLACIIVDDDVEESLTIAPDQGHGVNSESTVSVTAGELADIQSGDKIILVRGTVRYKDIFKRVRRTHFAHVYSGTDPANLTGSYHPRGNHAD